ncbi:MAG: ABC transporter permease [Planctomycetes bacterium]|nr:ABC transporter permease [Planctomycetota bacterium]MCC7399762.1 ABC transporter permease [Planctomycetota bacterium]
MSFVRTYDTATASKSPLRHLLSIVHYPGVIWQNRFMVQNFLRRDLMGRFHGSLLGAYWLLMQPLFLFAVYYFVFGLLNGKLGPEFALYMFSGVVCFHALTEATSTGCVIITDNGNLVKKVAFPSEVLPLHGALASLVVFGVGALVTLVLGLAFGVLRPTWLLLALPLTAFAQLTMTMGFIFLLGTWHVFVRDTAQLWRILSMAWMFMSPVFWHIEDLAKLPPWVVTLLTNFNPAYPLIQAHRAAMGMVGPEFVDFWGLLATAMAWGVGLLLAGYANFVAKKHMFADLI